MSKQARKEGLTSLAELQNHIKRDPEAYTEEFQQQLLHFRSTLDIFKLRPSASSDELSHLVQFLAAVAHCYPHDLSDLPKELVALLEEHGEALDTDLRLGLCRALIMLRNKGMVKSSSVLELFFKLFRVPDKLLRETLYRHVINDIKQINKKQKNNAINKSLQNFMFVMLKDPSIIAAKKSLDAMIELYIKGVWTDDKTVNVIATALLSEKTKLMATALRFFLKSNDELEEEAADADDDNDIEGEYKSILVANEYNKKTAKRQKKRDKALRLLKKQERKATKAPSFNFAALHLINDPQSLAEKMFVKLKKSKTVKFEIRLMMINFISRLIGIHELFVLEFYSYMQRFLDQRQHVTQILIFIAQASHPLVPGDTIEPVLRTIANNFISERSPAEHIAVGLNAIREICMRCPLAMPEELLLDLIQYDKNRSPSVVMAARSLIQAFRELNPALLDKKHRGRPGVSFDPTQEGLLYGKEIVHDVIPGTELLSEVLSKAHAEGGQEKDHDNDDDDDDDDVGDDDDANDSDSSNDDGDDNDQPEETRPGHMTVSGLLLKGPRAKAQRRQRKLAMAKMEAEEREKVLAEASEKEQKKKALMELTSTRVLTQEDFEKMKELEAQKLIDPLGNEGKRASERAEILNELDIIPEMKRKKLDKEERLQMVYAGREGRGKFGARKGKLNEQSSTSNRDKLKKKNPNMIKHSQSFRSKKAMSMHKRQALGHKKRQRGKKR